MPETHESKDGDDGRAINLTPPMDNLINAELIMHNGDKFEIGKSKRRVLGPDGKTVGTYDIDSSLNSFFYEVEFPDGMIKEYAANVIAQNLLSQVDAEGYSTTLLEGIVDFKKDQSAVEKSDKFIVTKQGRRKLRKKTQDWKLLVAWKDRSAFERSQRIKFCWSCRVCKS